MSYKNIIFRKEGKIAKITLNRPDKLNALSPELIGELEKVIEEVKSDRDVRVLVITGSGKAFSAGADVGAMVEATPLQAKESSLRGHRVFRMLEELDIPVIAAINGYALGGGCELALACDIRIASEKAWLGQPEINLGIIPGWGGCIRLPRMVGVAKAMEIILTGERISAQEALQAGLVNKVVPEDKLEATVNELAEKLASKPPIAVKLAKNVIRKGLECDLEAGIGLENSAFSLCFATKDQKEGMKAFLEKRQPQFKGE
ncbi:MAG: enoyl-CoA hydratase/isomerase family protein [Candidatus Freyarchaeota archaeon]|nr:enoyl-CoA hydratase/isomerase family protein [Candidatus Jordarchaeia archaeon]